VTIVNPVRSRVLWADSSIDNLEDQITLVKDNNLKATWLLQYDTLFDQEIINTFKKLERDQEQEIGTYLEVSNKLASDSNVTYKIAEGDYYTPNKVFLSGYSHIDRKKLINTYFKKFKEIYKKYPKVAGVWYIDAYSQNLIEKLGVISIVTVADQFDTDGQSIWGKYYSMPYYPSRYNALEPANDIKNKNSLVVIQWAQRHLTLGYGRKVRDSRQSFQANDYINNGYNFSYFENLIQDYLRNKENEFIQITIGIEVGQEGIKFSQEFKKQLNKISDLKSLGEIDDVTMSDFARWYQKKYQGLSPSHLITDESSYWYMSPDFRIGVFEDNGKYYLKDLRYYNNIPYRNYFYEDNNKYLDRKVEAIIDNVMDGSRIRLGTSQNIEFIEDSSGLVINLDNDSIKINQEGVFINGQIKVENISYNNSVRDKFFLLLEINAIRKHAINYLDQYKFSKINGNFYIGSQISSTKFLGLRSFKPGIYEFNTQTLTNFLSPANIVKKWKPWIN